MLRRAHQIATAVFLAETAELGITTTQFGILYLLKHRPSIDQVSVARLLGLDRSTTGMVLKTLEAAGHVSRVVGSADKRRRNLQLTPAGAELLVKLDSRAAKAVEHLLAPLDPDERPVFLGLLTKLTDAFNATSRVPLIGDLSARSDAGDL